MHRFEAPVPLSRSLIWSLQSQSYQAGMRAWEAGIVPSHISSNAFVAERYARVIEGFARDRGGRDGPVTIVELGSGSGRLAFYILRSLEKIWQAAAGSLPPFRYILTDFATDNIDAWQKSGAFDDFARRGLVDFAHFDADMPSSLALRQSGDQIDIDGRLPNLVMVANYVVDSLRQDEFHVENGVLSEVRVAAASSKTGELTDPEVRASIELERERAPIDLPYYNDKILDGLLERYQRKLLRSTFLFPTAFVGAMVFLQRMTAGPMLSLVGARGYRSLAEMEGLESAPLNLADGYFSMPGNFDALGGVAAAHGGGAMVSEDVDGLFLTGGFLMGARPAAMPETSRAFRNALGNGGARDTYGLLWNIGGVAGDLPPSTALFALRLSNYDPRTMMHLSPAIEKAAKSESRRVRAAMVDALEKVAENHYPLGSSRDMIYRQGRLFQTFEAHSRALACFQESANDSGDHYMRHYRMAQCHVAMGEVAKARQHLDHCLQENPEFDRALKMQAKIAKL